MISHGAATTSSLKSSNAVASNTTSVACRGNPHGEFLTADMDAHSRETGWPKPVNSAHGGGASAPAQSLVRTGGDRAENLRRPASQKVVRSLNNTARARTLRSPVISYPIRSPARSAAHCAPGHAPHEVLLHGECEQKHRNSRHGADGCNLAP